MGKRRAKEGETEGRKRKGRKEEGRIGRKGRVRRRVRNIRIDGENSKKERMKER